MCLLFGEIGKKEVFTSYMRQMQFRSINFEVKANEFAIGDTTAAAAAKSLQSCLTLCDPIDGSPPGSPVPGILQARTLEWVAISFSKS